jgi:hypothetical protein
MLLHFNYGLLTFPQVSVHGQRGERRQGSAGEDLKYVLASFGSLLVFPVMYFPCLLGFHAGFLSRCAYVLLQACG